MKLPVTQTDIYAAMARLDQLKAKAEPECDAIRITPVTGDPVAELRQLCSEITGRELDLWLYFVLPGSSEYVESLHEAARLDQLAAILGKDTVARTLGETSAVQRQWVADAVRDHVARATRDLWVANADEAAGEEVRLAFARHFMGRPGPADAPSGSCEL